MSQSFIGKRFLGSFPVDNHFAGLAFVISKSNNINCEIVQGLELWNLLKANLLRANLIQSRCGSGTALGHPVSDFWQKI